LKAQQEKFPAAAIRNAVYSAIWHGQKSWNGVAILARGTDPIETRRGLPGAVSSRGAAGLSATCCTRLDYAVRTLHPNERIHTFWDYFRNAWDRNAGLRLDHVLLSPDLARRLVAAEVDRHVRGWEKASDHAPAWIQLGTSM